jgi:hypothetical protein
MARSCLSDSARTTDFRFKTALENAAKDWNILAAVVEIKEHREQEAPAGESLPAPLTPAGASASARVRRLSGPILHWLAAAR